MSFKEELESGKFVVVAELQPPKGNDLSELYDDADRLKGGVDAINVPALQNAIMRLGSLSVCSLLKAKGLEVIFNLSCSDRNRLALQSDLLNASALGLNNVLLLQGDHPSIGDHFEGQAVFDLDVMGLLEPFIKKVAHFKVPTIVGITLLKSVGMARYVNKHVEGASIPDSIIDQLMRASDKQRASIEIAGGLIKALKPLCQGVQIIPIGWEHQIPALLDYGGLERTHWKMK